MNKTIIGNVLCGILLLGWSGISFGMEPAGPPVSEWDQYRCAGSRSASESESYSRSDSYSESRSCLGSGDSCLKNKPASSSYCIGYEECSYPSVSSDSYGEEVRIGTVIKAYKKGKKNQAVHGDVMMIFDYENDKCQATLQCYENKGLEHKTGLYTRFFNNSNVSIEDAHLKKIKAAAVEEQPFTFKIESKAKHTANVYEVTKVRTLNTEEDIDKYNINQKSAPKKAKQYEKAPKKDKQHEKKFCSIQ